MEYWCFVTFETFLIKLYILCINFNAVVISYDAAKLENVVKIYVPTWSIFVGPVTYIMPVPHNQ